MIPLKVLKISYDPSGKNYAVILKEVGGEICIPIIIGSFEAQSIALAIEVIEAPRPLTHDLICDMINSLDLDLSSVKINHLEDGVFYSKIEFKTMDSKILSLDARPSDSISIAIRLNIPILISPKILDEAGVKENYFKEETSKNSNIISLKSLKKKLEHAIEKEEYEKAAKIRDTISKLNS